MKSRERSSPGPFKEDERRRGALALAAGLSAVLAGLLLAWQAKPSQSSPAESPVTAPRNFQPPPKPGSYVTLKRVIRTNTPLGEVIIHAGDRRKLLETKGDTYYIEYYGYSVPVQAVDIGKAEP